MWISTIACVIYTLSLRVDGRVMPNHERLRRRLNTESFESTLSIIAPLLPVNGMDETLYDHADHDEIVYLDAECARNASYADYLREHLIEEEAECFVANQFQPNALLSGSFFYFYLQWNTDAAEDCADGVTIDFEAFCISKIEFEPMFTTTSAHPTTYSPTTYSPTVDPTHEPSADPTHEPSADPTHEPSADPTQIPTAPSLDCEWTSDGACTGSVISESTVWHMMTRDDCILQCKMHSNCNCATYIEGHVCRMQTGYSIESIDSLSMGLNYEALLMTDARDACVSDNEVNSDTLFRFNDGMWGDWLGADYCEEGKFARGFMIRSEWPVGGGDDTAANAVKLYCSSPGWSDSGNRNVCPSTSDLSCSKVGAFEGYWGDWCASGAQCPSGEFIVGFDQKVEGAIGNGDDTGLNDIAALCSDGTIVKAACNTAEYGRWGHWSAGSEYRFAVCADGSRVCGLNQKAEAQQGGGDDTALNAVRMYCCESDDAQSATAINVVHTVDEQPESGTIPRSVVTIDLGSWPMMALVLIVLVLLIANLCRMAKIKNTRTYAKVDIADSEDMSENEVEAINIE